MRIDVTPEQFKDFVRIGIPLIVGLNSHLTIKYRTKKAFSEMARLNLAAPKEIQEFLKSYALSEPIWLFFVTSVYLYFVLPMASELIEVLMVLMSSLFLIMVTNIVLNFRVTSRFEKLWNEIIGRNASKSEELILSKDFLTVALKSAASRNKRRS